MTTKCKNDDKVQIIAKNDKKKKYKPVFCFKVKKMMLMVRGGGRVAGSVMSVIEVVRVPWYVVVVRVFRGASGLTKVSYMPYEESR